MSRSPGSCASSRRLVNHPLPSFGVEDERVVTGESEGREVFADHVGSRFLLQPTPLRDPNQSNAGPGEGFLYG
jgi:hypothetical protein